MIDPRGMSAVEWTDRMAIDLEFVGVPVMRLDREEDWRAWVMNILNTNVDVLSETPEPYQYSDWVEWALRFNELILLGA